MKEKPQALRYPRPAELEKLGRGHGVVESSAGTGKTFLLEHLFVDLILTRGLSCEEILVVTFTEKATAELILRLRKLIARLAELQPDDPQAIEAATAPANATWLIDDGARKILRQALLAFDRASIFTIHGFCQRVLRDHAFVQGRFFDEELVGEETAFNDAFHEALRTDVANNSDLAAAVQAWLGHGRSVENLRLLLHACDREASAQLRRPYDKARLSSALAAWQPVAADGAPVRQLLKAAKVHGKTINCIVARLARVSELVAAHSGDHVGFLAAMQDLPREPAMKNGLGYVLEKLSAREDLGALEMWVRQLHEALAPLEVLLAQHFLPLIRERATRRKRKAGMFDFSDMLSLVEKALADPGPAGHALLEALRRRYRHALIDEFQDTDEIQWSIFRRIFVESSDGYALTVIGDPKQAIYGFRGADVRAYLGATGALDKAGGNHLTLNRNFRSTAEMIEATNLIFDQSAEFFRQASGITYDEPAQCGRPELRLIDSAGATPVVVFGVEADGPKLSANQARAAVQTAIVEELLRLRDPESPLRFSSKGDDGKLCARRIFILTFTNFESQAMGRALGAAEIPYAFYKLGNLFESPEAAEILAVLRAVVAPEDRSLRAQALLTGFFDLDVTGAAACADLGLTAPPVQLLLHFASLASKGEIPALFTSMIDDSGIVRREVFADASERALTNITHVLEILQAEWARTRASVPELAELLAAFVKGTRKPPGQEGDLQRLETEKEAVQILTVHKAKGLEADVVFLCGGTGEKKSNPTNVFHENGRRVLHLGPWDEAGKQLWRMEKEDERSRVLYVGLTRARYRLYLPHYPPEFERLDGPYRRVNQRLDAILGMQRERSHPHFRVRTLPPDFAHRATSAPAQTPMRATFLPELLVPAHEPDDLAEIRAKRSGFTVTSYTAVKRARGGFTPFEDTAGMRVARENAPGRTDGGDRLPGGAETGIFLHDVLATVELGELASAPDFAGWFAKPAVASLFERLGRRHGRPADHLPLAARLVHRAYTVPVHLGGNVIAGLASAEKTLREAEFLFPIPERAHPLLSQPQTGAPSWKVERGAVKGFVDLLFEHNGQVYVCDWKSDDLPRFDRDTLARHCGENYDVQARIYAIATLRMCGITSAADYAAKFGGVVFCFLRGLTDEDTGIHFWKPAWKDILAWETDMVGQQFWGIAR